MRALTLKIRLTLLAFIVYLAIIAIGHVPQSHASPDPSPLFDVPNYTLNDSTYLFLPQNRAISENDVFVARLPEIFPKETSLNEKFSLTKIESTSKAERYRISASEGREYVVDRLSLSSLGIRLTASAQGMILSWPSKAAESHNVTRLLLLFVDARNGSVRNYFTVTSQTGADVPERGVPLEPVVSVTHQDLIKLSQVDSTASLRKTEEFILNVIGDLEELVLRLEQGVTTSGTEERLRKNLETLNRAIPSGSSEYVLLENFNTQVLRLIGKRDASTYYSVLRLSSALRQGLWQDALSHHGSKDSVSVKSSENAFPTVRALAAAADAPVNYIEMCEKEGIEVPKKAPKLPECLTEKKACNDWVRIGGTFNGSDLNALEGKYDAYLFKWERKDTICFYNPRFKSGNQRTFNGLHCYKRSNCKVCTLESQIETANGAPYEFGSEDISSFSTPFTLDSKADCSGCHAPGPLAPLTKFYQAVKGSTQSLNTICSKQGGPIWIGPTVNNKGDRFFSFSQPSGSRKVEAPMACDGCHTGGFVKTNSEFCSIAKAACEKNGAMHDTLQDSQKVQFSEDFTAEQEARILSNNLGCEFDDLIGCASKETSGGGDGSGGPGSKSLLKLKFEKIVNGKGTTTLIPPGMKELSCGKDCYVYPKGATVVVRAVPATAGGVDIEGCDRLDELESRSDCTVKLDKDRTVTIYYFSWKVNFASLILAVKPPIPAGAPGDPGTIEARMINVGVHSVSCPNWTPAPGDRQCTRIGGTGGWFEITAKPNPGFVLSKIEGCERGENDPIEKCRVIADQRETRVTAIFSPNTAPLYLSVSPPDKNLNPGTITLKNPIAPTCKVWTPAAGDKACHDAKKGETYTVSATANAGYVFAGFTGCTVDMATKSCTFKKTENGQRIIARFVPAPTVAPKKYWKLQITRYPPDPGHVMGDVIVSAPGGKQGNRCVGASDSSGCYSFVENEVVTIRGAAKGIYKFVGFSGACTGTAPCQIKMTADKQVTAEFTPAEYMKLQIIRDPAAPTTITGQVNVSAPGGQQGRRCSEIGSPPDCFSFREDEMVTISATPNGTNRFVGFSGDCSGTDPCVLKMTRDRDKAVTVKFEAPLPPTRHELNVRRNGSGSGTVVFRSGDFGSCGVWCEIYARGSDVQLRATPDTNSEFAGWSGGGCSGVYPICTVKMSSDQQVTATFNLKSGGGGGGNPTPPGPLPTPTPTRTTAPNLPPCNVNQEFIIPDILADNHHTFTFAACLASQVTILACDSPDSVEPPGILKPVAYGSEGGLSRTIYDVINAVTRVKQPQRLSSVGLYLNGSHLFIDACPIKIRVR